MLHLRLPLLALTCLLFTTACSEKTYDLSDRDVTIGETKETTTVMTMDNGTIKVLLNGNALAEGKLTGSNTTTERKTITKITNDEIIEYTTLLTVSKDIKRYDMAGEIKTEEEASPILNQTITWRLEGDEFVPDLPGASPAQLAELKPTPVGKNLVFPEEPIAVGHKWQLEPEALSDFLGTDAGDDVKGTGEIEFLGVEDYEGESCAKLKVSLNLQGPMPEEDADIKSGTMYLVISGTTYRSLESKIDVGGDLSGTMKVEMKSKDGVDMIMQAQVTLNATETLISN